MEVLFPGRCCACESHLKFAPNGWFCGPCWDEVAPVDHPICHCCGIGIASSQVAEMANWRCSRCLKAPPSFLAARVLGPYEGALGAAIRQLKYRGNTGLAPALVGRVPALPQVLAPVDLLMPVPLHPRRLRQRGFNQAGRLATALGQKLGVPVMDGVLIRQRDSVSQVGLSRSQRLANMRGTFALSDPAPIAGRRVLLVDDVMTTGATVDACARVLMRGGATQVCVWAMARQELG